MTQGTTPQPPGSSVDGSGDTIPGLASLRQVGQEYSPDGEQRPLGGYLVTMGAYGAYVAALVTAARLTGRRAPERVAAADLALFSVATHKLARVITKDSITSPLRAPFTRYSGVGGPAELNEEVRHAGGIRHSLGELLTCPFCIGMWISTSFSAGLVFAPQMTRLVASTLTALAASDFLQFAYAKTYSSAE